MEQPLISIIIPMYNVEEYLNKCLDSVINQTYKKLEIILVDDGSPDNTVQVAQDWINDHEERFLRTKVITVEKNTGVTGNYIRAEQNCSGEWIKNIDGDDLLVPTAIADLVGVARHLRVQHPD